MIQCICSVVLIFCAFVNAVGNEYCDASDWDGECSAENKAGLVAPKFIFYDVNPPEGFNLRRDVFMRMVIFTRQLKEENWYLVLPPWPHLYHWQSDLPFQSRLPWSLFFNLSSLSSFAPVVEMQEFFQTGAKVIEDVYVLQHFEDTFTTGNFEDRMMMAACQERLFYKKIAGGYSGDFWGFGNLTARNVDCLSFHGPTSQLAEILRNTKARTVMFDHAEVALHDRFGDKTYWEARKSMKFADHLIREASRFRKTALNSTDEAEGTSWPNEKRTAVGGNYLCVHLRRKDFLRGRSKDVPSIKGAAAQIKKALTDLNLSVVFVATDASENEKAELRSHLENYQVVTYEPSNEMKLKFKDGGIAIIEQIICSHARKFIGSHESTFSFRIQEEREIMGFRPETTFNRLCGDEEPKCKPPSKWLIVH